MFRAYNCLSARVYSTSKNVSGFKEVPVARGLPLIGTALSVLAAGQKFHLYVDRRHKELGPIYREKLGLQNSIFLCDPREMRRIFTLDGKYPEHYLPHAWVVYNKMFSCKRGLFFMEGEEWLKYRRIMNKYLLKNNISAELNNVFISVVDNLIKRWKQKSGMIIDNLEHELYRHSVTFIIATLMGSGFIDEMKNFEDDIDRLTVIFSSIFETTAMLSKIPVEKLAVRFNLPVWKRFVTSVNSSLDSSRNMLKKMTGKCSEDGLLRKLLNEEVDHDIIVSVVVDLMLAAGDTTAYATQWALYLLSKDRHIQERLCEDHTGAYLKGVIKETLRLYPSAVFITRILPRPENIFEYQLSSGELVILSLYTSGHSEENFPDSETFWPERWLRTNDGYLGVNNINAYLPFALGARSCVGRKIAESQMSLTIHKIVSNFWLDLMEEVDMILKMVPVPNKPIKITISSK